MVKRSSSLVAATLLLSGSCAGGGLISGIDGQELRNIARAVDTNPDPSVVEISLSASMIEYKFLEGKMTEMLAYNEQIPGPLIEANVGDRIIVHFTNMLEEPSTIHWHGVRLASNMDGSPLSQELVMPGESFDYDFRVPDAGLYWYHPHHNEEDQIQSGLYGALLVRSAEEPEFTRERVMVLSDVMLDGMGMVMPMDHNVQDPYQQALGMEGNVQLVNGQVLPVIKLQPGGRERWRILNAAGGRYFKLATPGHGMTLIGVDGGLIEEPLDVSSILLSPGERADLVIDSGDAVQEAGTLTNQSYARLADTVFDPEPSRDIAVLAYAGERAVSTPAIPQQLREVEELQVPSEARMFTFNADLDPPLPDPPMAMESSATGSLPSPAHTGTSRHGASDAMGGGGSGMPGSGAARFMINGKMWPDIPEFEVERDAVELWEVWNHTQMDHPLHIHGFHFQVLDLNGEPWPFRGWKDTVNVPAGNSGENRLHILVKYDGSPGDWLYHCHILHHNAMGMMGAFHVLP